MPARRLATFLLLSCLLTIPAAATAAQASSGGAAETEWNGSDSRLSVVVRAAGEHRYALSREGRLLFSADRGRSWESRSEALPVKRVWPFTGEERRACTAVAVTHGDWRRLAVTTKKHLFLSRDAGRSWRRLPLGSPVSSANYLTSVTFDPQNPQRIYLGTSFNGIYVSDNLGRSWKKISERFPPLYRGAGFYEEITALAMSPAEQGVLYLASRFERTLYRYDTGSRALQAIPFPEGMTGFHGISSREEGESPVELHGERRRFLYRPGTNSWSDKPPLLLRRDGGSGAQGAGGAVTGREGASASAEYADRRGIYLNSWNARGKRLQQHLDFMERYGFDTIVVDVKDDWGKLTYASQLAAPRNYGAVRGNLDLERLLEEAHARGFYVVGRMVVFKDQALYRARGEDLAIWNYRREEAWGHKVEERDAETGETRMVQREFWVDPFSEEVWEYNVAIARELEELGIDELQFDYIRFPSDGDLSSVRYRHRRKGMLKSEALESFLRMASRRIDVPISTDLYGFNSWYLMGNWIGQDIAMMSRYVDVICPMYYPSHFPSSFLKSDDYLQRAYTIYRTGTERARRLVAGRSEIRPYVQAFRVGGELRMDEQRYYRYLSLQLQGVFDADGSGYTLWNNANRYYMVDGSTPVLNGASRDGTVQRHMAGP